MLRVGMRPGSCSAAPRGSWAASSPPSASLRGGARRSRRWRSSCRGTHTCADRAMKTVNYFNPTSAGLPQENSQYFARRNGRNAGVMVAELSLAHAGSHGMTVIQADHARAAVTDGSSGARCRSRRGQLAAPAMLYVAARHCMRLGRHAPTRTPVVPGPRAAYD